ncbi:MAG: BatA domain-containing protein [Pirellulales bacterium]
MTFIQPLLLAGLALIFIPILIHLFNRRKAKVIEWGAMRFLAGSMVSRRRRVQIEELILLALRCLLVALLVLAVARPFVPVGASLGWMLVLPALLLGAIILAVGTVMLNKGLPRLILFCSVAAVVGLLAVASQSERVRQMKLWSAKGTQDVAIVIDGSTSMSLASDGRSNFDRAIEEARAVIDGLEVGDGVSIVLAGSTPTAVTPSPLSAGGELSERLLELKPVGGSMSVVDALDVAAATLARGGNAAKKIVLLTDGQAVGWDTENVARWEYLQETLDKLSTKPKVILRNLTLPLNYRNVSVASIEPARRMIGTDRAVAIRVRVENTGTDTIVPEGVRLQIGEQTALTETVAPIAPGASQVVEFQHQFSGGGPQVLSARVLVSDDLPGDDVRSRVVSTFDSLPVLLVDGNGAYRARDQATTFIELALTPPPETTRANRRGGDATGPDALPVEPTFVTTKVISAPDFNDRVALEDYRVVVLANVARLPADVCQRLTEFVERGGGLLIAPGRESEPEFYNQWRSTAGGPLLPAQIAERITLAYDAAASKPSLSTFTHAALKRFADGPTDLGDAAFTGYWKIQPTAAITTATGGNLSSGDPLLLESGVGRGRVALTAVSLDNQDGNLPAQMAFLPMVHELVYHLASPILPDMNAQLANVINIRLPLPYTEAAPAEEAAEADGDEESELTAKVIAPSGKTREAAVAVADGFVTVTLLGAAEAGLYRVKLPKPYHDLVLRADGSAAGESDASEARTAATIGVPIALTTSADESRLIPMGEVEEATADRFTDFFVAHNRENLAAVLQGDVPGQELWKLMALGALLALLGENLVTRWIGKNRKTGNTEAVDFTNEGQRMTSRRAEAKGLVEAARSRRTAKRRAAETVASNN